MDGAVTWRGRTGEHSHEVEAGWQTSYEYQAFKMFFTGMGDSYVDFLSPAGSPLNTVLCDADPTLNPNASDPNQITGNGCSQKTHSNDVDTLQRGYFIGLYAQDRWKPTSWLMVMPGLRWDINRVWVPGGLPADAYRTLVINARTVNTGDYQMANGFGPRLTGIADLTGDKKTIFQASYGRSTEQLYLTTVSDAQSSYQAQSLTYTWNQAAKRFDPITNQATPNNTLVDSAGRTFPHHDELFFRLSREIARNTVAEVDYTYRYYTNILEQAEVNRIWDPSGSRVAGYVDPSHPNAVFVYTNDNRNWQKYSGFDLIFESRPTPNLDFFGSYTLSWTWGPGYSENRGGLGQFYNPRDAQFFSGWNPSSDVRHIIKTQTTYTLHGAVIGATVNWRSGYANFKQFPVNAPFTTNSRFRSPFGTDPSATNDIHQWTEFRVPDLFVVSLLLGYDFYELTRNHFLLTVSMENLLNNYTPVGLQTSETAPPTRFGTVTARNNPSFRTTIGLKYTY